MAKLSVIARDEVAPADAYPVDRAASGIRSCALLSPPAFSLWACDVELIDGGTIEWPERHGDDGIYIVSGELDIDGRRCPTGGAVIVESGVAAVARAVGVTHLVHFGSRDDSPPRDGLGGPVAEHGHGVHVVGPAGVIQSGEGNSSRAVWFSDGTCATCRCQLFVVAAPTLDGKRGAAHSHSEDEIILVLDGTIKMGSYTLGPFSALCVPGDVRYALNGQPGGHRFLNWRRDVSEQIYELGSDPIVETGLARGGRATNDVR